MCFSAGASFVSGAILVPAGVYCVRTAWGRNREFLALAITPAVFGIQQCCEGFVWLGVQRDDPVFTRSAALSFLFFALVFWPAWVPFMAMRIDRQVHRRRATLLGVSAAAGLIASLVVYAPLLCNSREWLHTDVAFHSIRYEFESLLAYAWIPRTLWQLAYVAVVSVPFLILPHRSLGVFGWLVAASAVLAHGAYWYAFISVWCAFAAILSGWLVWVFYRLPPAPSLEDPRPAAVARHSW